MCDSENSKKNKTIKLFTIGFAKKSAEEFFKKLSLAGIKCLIDIRLNNVSQLAGFTKKGDLEYFLRAIANIKYKHEVSLAPTKDILDAYKKRKIDWKEYERRFFELLEVRTPEKNLCSDDFDYVCLLCSEPKPEKCHRRLVAEYLKRKWNNVEIHHL